MKDNTRNWASFGNAFAKNLFADRLTSYNKCFAGAHPEKDHLFVETPQNAKFVLKKIHTINKNESNSNLQITLRNCKLETSFLKSCSIVPKMLGLDSASNPHREPDAPTDYSTSKLSEVTFDVNENNTKVTPEQLASATKTNTLEGLSIYDVLISEDEIKHFKYFAGMCTKRKMLNFCSYTNKKLSELFKCSPVTVKRRIASFLKAGLIHIANPASPHRRIYLLYLIDHQQKLTPVSKTICISTGSREGHNWVTTGSGVGHNGHISGSSDPIYQINSNSNSIEGCENSESFVSPENQAANDDVLEDSAHENKNTAARCTDTMQIDMWLREWLELYDYKKNQYFKRTNCLTYFLKIFEIGEISFDDLKAKTREYLDSLADPDYKDAPQNWLREKKYLLTFPKAKKQQMVRGQKTEEYKPVNTVQGPEPEAPAAIPHDPRKTKLAILKAKLPLIKQGVDKSDLDEVLSQIKALEDETTVPIDTKKEPEGPKPDPKPQDKTRAMMPEIIHEVQSFTSLKKIFDLSQFSKDPRDLTGMRQQPSQEGNPDPKLNLQKI